MHIYSPKWLHHGRGRNPCSIFSVDVQPKGKRLASAGQDCAVKIWNLSLIASLAIPFNSSLSINSSLSSTLNPKTPFHSLSKNSDNPSQQQQPPQGALLASISSHSSAVNCVRWSPNGNLLASGGDDAVVLIYELLKGTISQNPAFSSGTGPNIENWRVKRPLRAHSGDVTDVCWSPDGEKLASASVDNFIHIWNIRNERIIVRLEGHRGLVKGVSWDPVGRYLASQSDDRTVRIWRVADWKEEKTISKPFQQAVYKENSMAFFLRISWSPCGTNLLAVNAYKKPGAHHAPMFSRESGFNDQLEFIGHREPVVTSRFSSRLYRTHPDKIARQRKLTSTNEKQSNLSKKVDQPKDDEIYTVLALGSKDSGASIWQATARRPFFEMSQMFDSDVIDLAWGTDGYTLVSCSTDGQVMYQRFDEMELGVVVTPEETREILTKAWRQFGGDGKANKLIAESVNQLQMEIEHTKERNITSVRPKSKHTNQIQSVEETIDPERLQLAMSTSKIQSPTAMMMSEERRNSLPAPIIQAAADVKKNGPTPPADPQLIAKQAETRVRGGKRRITPMAVSADAPSTQQPNSQPMSILMETDEIRPSPLKKQRKDLDLNNNKTKDTTPFTTTPNGIDHIRPNGRHLSMAPVTNLIPPGSKPVSHAAHLYAPSVIGLSMMLLPEKGGEGPGRCRIISTDVPPIMIESKEHHAGGGGYVVTCSKGGETQWRDYHPKTSPVTALAGVGGKFVAVGTADGSLYLYSAKSGRRLTPAICIDSAPYILDALVVKKEGISENNDDQDDERWFAVIITRSALCSVFDVKEKRLVCARSAASLLAKPSEPEADEKNQDQSLKAKIIREVSHCRVTEHGEPILILSDGHAFLYSRDFCTWLRVADDFSPNSDYQRLVSSSKSVGILRSLQAESGRANKSNMSLSGMGDLRRAAVESLSHLETLMESAIALGSASDYRYYLTNYATRVAAAVSDDVENCASRLREVCDNLLNVNNPSEDAIILGMSGRELLKQAVLPVISANRQMQRLVSEYMESLAELANVSS